MIKNKGRAKTNLVRIKHLPDRKLEIFSEIRGWTPARGKMTLAGNSIMAFFERHHSSKVNGRIFPDASGLYGGIISWDNGQTWVLETKSIHVKNNMPVPAARLDQVQKSMAENMKSGTSQRAPGPSAESQGLKNGVIEDDDESVSASSEEEEYVHEWKMSAHAAPTHAPEVLEYMNRDKLFTWKIVDISHITPLKKQDELWLPNFQSQVLKQRCSRLVQRIATYILEHADKSDEEPEAVVEIKTLKDVNFETCTESELRAFFEDKAYQKDVQTMLKLYLEIGISQLMQKKDRF